MTQSLLTPQNISLLNEWDLSNYPNSVSQKMNGCEIKGIMVVPFITDLIEELLEEQDDTPYISSETLLEQNGYDIITQSPYELEKDGESITGECALWLVSHLRHLHNNTNNNAPIPLGTLKVGDTVFRTIHNECCEGWEATSYVKDVVREIKLGTKGTLPTVISFNVESDIYLNDNNECSYGQCFCFSTADALLEHIRVTDLK